MEKPTLKYVPQLDGLRAIAVVMVFCHHAINIPLLWAGVDLFFILSGYLITTILLRDSEQMSFRKLIGRFYLRRAERILPAYVLFLVVAYPFVRAEWHANWGYYVGFLQNVPYALSPGFSPLTPLWSLAIEQHFYLIWPILIFFLPRRWLAPSMLVLLVGVPLLRVACTPLFSNAVTICALTPFRVDALAAGALAALILPGCKAATAKRAAQVAMVAGVIFYFLLAFHHPWFSRAANSATFNGLAYSLNILILGGLFVWVIFSEGTWLTRILSTPAMRWMGRISYSFYLFHLLVLMRMQRLLPQKPAAACAFVITFVIASLSWILVEKPILGLSASHRGARVRAKEGEVRVG